MRSILIGIFALSALIVVLPHAHAQGAKNRGTAPVGHRQPTAQDAQGVQGRGSVDQATKNADERPMARVNCGCIGSRWMVLGSRHQSGMALCGATVSSII